MISGRVVCSPGVPLDPAALRATGPPASRHEAEGRVALCEGEPRFQDADLARLAATRGNAAAWLELHARIGQRAPEEVQGRFACAIVDTRSGQALLAVDRFGIDSLCYSLADGALSFATRADAVAATPAALDPQAIYDYLYFHTIPSPRTVREGVLRLQPAHRALVAGARCEVARYWAPTFAEHDPTPLPALRDEFLSLVEQAVRTAAAGDATGTFLSGGTDSSTVAGMLGRVGGRPARTYSIGFDAQGYDEMAYARIAAKHFGTAHHEYYVTPDDLVTHLPAVVAELDQPFGNSSVLPAFCCARMAREDGVDRLLAGDGGDELFGGNTRYAKQRVFAAYERIPSPLRRAIEHGVDRMPALARLPLLSKAASYVGQARVPMPDRMQMYNLLTRLGVESLLEPGFLARVHTGEPLLAERQVYAESEGMSLINRMLAYDWKYTLADNDLPKVVIATRAAGVAVGFPLLDDRLVAFSMRLRPGLKLRGLSLRYFFRQALRGFLPDEIIRKKKHGFGLPFGHWVVSHPGLRSFALDALASLKQRGYVRPAFVDEVVERHLPAHPGYYGELVWILMMLELWLRKSPSPARAS